jgi:hypothetical protein
MVTLLVTVVVVLVWAALIAWGLATWIRRALTRRQRDVTALRSHHRALARLSVIDGAGTDEPESSFRLRRQSHVRVVGLVGEGNAITNPGGRTDLTPELPPNLPPAPPAPTPPTLPPLPEPPPEPTPAAPVAPYAFDRERAPRPISLRATRFPVPVFAPRALVGVLVAGACAVLVAGVVRSVTAGDGSTRHGPPPSAGVTSRPSTASPVVASTTTVPPAPAVRLVSANGGTASFVVGAGPTSLTISATAPCWVRVTTGTNNNSTSLFEGTLAAGEQRSFANAAPLTVRLGNPGAATLMIDGQPVQLPPNGQGNAPIDVELRSA